MTIHEDYYFFYSFFDFLYIWISLGILEGNEEVVENWIGGQDMKLFYENRRDCLGTESSSNYFYIGHLFRHLLCRSFQLLLTVSSSLVSSYPMVWLNTTVLVKFIVLQIAFVNCTEILH